VGTVRSRPRRSPRGLAPDPAGTYRALPSRRVFIPKADGRLRPLGVAALENKVVSHAVAKVLAAIWEEDFLGLSYGFRPGRPA
jgi:RNA-directed DNA polymerase